MVPGFATLVINTKKDEFALPGMKADAWKLLKNSII